MKMPFTKSPLEKLAQLLADAEAEVFNAQRKVDQLAEEAATGKVWEDANAALHIAERSVTARRKAHADAIAEAKALKAKQDQEAKEKRDNEAGDKLEDIARVADKDLDEWLLLTERCVVSSGRARENSPDYGITDLFAKLLTEIPISVKLKRGDMKHRVAAVRTGHAVLAQPVPAPVPAPPPALVTAVCALKAVAWLDAANVVQTAARGEDISLPPKTAQRAIEIGACCSVSDARRRTVKDNPGRLGKPLFRNCVQLSDGMVDTDREPFAPEPILRSAPANTPDPRFEIVQRGPARQVHVEGARSLDDVARNNSKENDK